MRAWATILGLSTAAYWLAGKLGHEPEIPEALAVGFALLALAVVATGTYLLWRRVRAVQTAAGVALILLSTTAFFLLTYLREIDVIGWRTYDAWFAPAFLGCVLCGVAAAILVALDRIDHPRRWKLATEHATTCSFFDSLLFRDVPDLTEHEDVDF
jgi:hypothetical protein